ncbi:MAG: radical SAM protein, partial [Frisingicoccus sp.]|nr:radical SAM protein [Frisingicoccus sp.]
MNASNTLKKLGIEQTFNYIYKDPDKNMTKIMDWADKFAEGQFASQRKIIREVITNPEHPYYDYVRRLFTDVDPNVTKTLAVNLFINAALVGWKREEKLRKKYNCNIPWAILLDPTSACNLHCTGCWAAEYGHKLNLTYDEIDDIIRQGKEMGVYFYIYTGGEPLVRKKDLIRLCEKHSDCVFLCFTNSTLIDEEFANEMLRVGNFVPAISLEGFEEATDGRRGQGVYQKVQKAMELLREKKLVYGISCCYTSANYDSITSEEFYDSLIEMGA